MLLPCEESCILSFSQSVAAGWRSEVIRTGKRSRLLVIMLDAVQVFLSTSTYRQATKTAAACMAKPARRQGKPSSYLTPTCLGM